jgi:predicted naringenin-chalcone synthase
VSQADAVLLAEEFAGLSRGEAGGREESTDAKRSWLRRVFLRSGVEQRGTVLAGERDDAAREAVFARVRAFYGDAEKIGPRGPTTATRMARYADEAPPLAERAAREGLAQAGVAAAEITHLITVSCTGFFAPGLDVELITRLGLRPYVRRTHIGFMGCHAAFNALAAARNIVRADAGARVLVVCVELCTLHFAYGWDPEKLVANALFADGAAACVVGAEGEAGARAGGGGAWRLVDTASLLLGGGREAMTWKIGDHGFEMTLSATLPSLIAGHVRPWCESWLGGMEVGEVERWAIHPGGPRILTAVRDALGLRAADLAASEDILRRHGNMSSATVLFVLRALAAAAVSGERCVAIGFGPGLMAEGMLLERIA